MTMANEFGSWLGDVTSQATGQAAWLNAQAAQRLDRDAQIARDQCVMRQWAVQLLALRKPDAAISEIIADARMLLGYINGVAAADDEDMTNMPTLRILADGRVTLGSTGQLDHAGTLSIECGEGDKLLARLDYAGWLGDETLSSVIWYDLDAATATGESISAAPIATALITIPGETAGEDSVVNDQLYRFRVVAVSSTGRQHVQRLEFVARGR